MRAGPRLLVHREPVPDGCLWCKAPLQPSKTKPRVFCSDRCRKRVARVTKKRVQLAYFLFRQMEEAFVWKERNADASESDIS